MPFSRSHGRSKSRSPAPNTLSFVSAISSRPPAFLPPSHYAAAAGISYPLPPSNVQEQDVRSPHMTPDVRYASPYTSSSSTLSPAYPTSTPTMSSQQERAATPSTPHASRVSRLLSRSPSKSSLGRSGSKSESREKLRDREETDKRQSQLSNIPLLEAQLLPSLRDTVDRMTHPPKPPVDHQTSGEPQRDLRGPPQPPDRRPNDDAPSVTFGRLSPHQIDTSTTARHPAVCATSSLRTHFTAQSAIPKSLRTPRVAVVSQSDHPADAARTPAGSTPNTPKPLLKSALRAPATPVLPADSSPRIDVRKTSRGTRTMMPRPVGTPNSRFAETLEYVSSPAMDPLVPRTRSRTGEDARAYKDLQKDRSPRLLQQSRSNPSTPRSTFGSLSRSNLPRARHLLHSDTESNSEIERRLKEKLQPGHLVVTNGATLSTSGSEDFTRDDRRRDGCSPSRLRRASPMTGIPALSSIRHDAGPSSISFSEPRPRSRADQKKPVGLGIAMASGSEPFPWRNGPDIERDYSESEHSSDTQDYASGRQHHRYPEEETSYTGDSPERPSRRAPYYSPSKRGHSKHNTRRQGDRDVVPEQRRRSPYPRVQATGIPVRREQVEFSSGGSDDSEATEGDVAEVANLSTSRHPRRNPPGPAGIDDDMSVYSDEVEGSYLAPPRRKRKGSRASASSPRDRHSPAPGMPLASALRQAIDSRTRKQDDSSGRRTSIAKSSKGNRRSVSVSPSNAMSRHSQKRSASPAPQQDAVNPEIHWRRSAEGRRLMAKKRNRLSASVDDLRERAGNLRKSPRPERPPSRTVHWATDEDTQTSPETAQHSQEPDVQSVPVDGAEKEREAFGIPASLSYEGLTASDEAGSHRSLPQSGSEYSVDDASMRADSRLSNISNDKWQDSASSGASGAFSKGAQALLEKLTIRRRAGSRSQGDELAKKSRDQPQNGILQPRQREERREEGHRPHEVEQRISSPPSSYGDDSGQVDPSPIQSWRTSLRPSVFKTQLARYGSTEMQRQEIISEILTSEQVYVQRLDSIVQTYILPLRSRDSRSWLPGVPPEVSRLFDWLEDIVVLHEEMLHSMRSMVLAWERGEIVERIAEPLRRFVPRLEVYQPYLVRVDEVKELIEGYNCDGGDQFGEYIRMRERSLEHPDNGLPHLLDEPVTRLTFYREMFKRLLNCTPKQHYDHLSALSLLHSMKTMMRVMEEVIVRESEYDFVKYVAARMDGLPPSIALARRERRLLHHGPMSCTVHAALPNQGDQTHDRDRFLSPALRQGWVSSTVAKDRSAGPRACANSLGLLEGNITAAQEEAVEIFVFTDVVLVAIPMGPISRSHTQENDEESWRLQRDVGLSRILHIAESPEGDSPLVTLDLLPMSPDSLETGVIAEDAMTTEITVVLPPDEDPIRGLWLSAFRKCHKHTMSSLSYPPNAEVHIAHGANNDLQLDTRQSLTAILASGLPLPKSPSVQLDEISTGISGDAAQQEREERGWWSLRFQQVLRELQRRDAALLQV